MSSRQFFNRSKEDPSESESYFQPGATPLRIKCPFTPSEGDAERSVKSSETKPAEPSCIARP